MSSTSDLRTQTAPPKTAFRFSMLLYDQRYRSVTIQIVFLFVLMLGIAWLVDNTISNLRALGKYFSFAFLSAPAGYDINQRPIEYNSQMTHGRAALVGLLNTAILAVMACALATVLGVIAGVLRLSNNWIVARLMTIYVELFRNIPTLVWIIIFGAIMTESMPAPSAFRGDTPSASMFLNDSVAITNRGVYIPAIQFATDLGTLPLGVVAPSINWLLVLVAIIGGIYANKAILKHATAVQNATGLRPRHGGKALLCCSAPWWFCSCCSAHIWSIRNCAASTLRTACICAIR